MIYSLMGSVLSFKNYRWRGGGGRPASPPSLILQKCAILYWYHSTSLATRDYLGLMLYDECWHNIELVDNSNIDKRGLGAKGLHLDMSGTTQSTMNFKSTVEQILRKISLNIM